MYFSIGVDNGVSGTIGLITANNDGSYAHAEICPTPVRDGLNVFFTGREKRFDPFAFCVLLDLFLKKNVYLNNTTETLSFCAIVERPMVNPTRFSTSIQAIRVYESTLCAFELFSNDQELHIPILTIHSAKWQPYFFPKIIKGHEEQKISSRTMCNKLFPNISLDNVPDGDGLLIALYGLEKILNGKFGTESLLVKTD